MPAFHITDSSTISDQMVLLSNVTDTTTDEDQSQETGYFSSHIWLPILLGSIGLMLVLGTALFAVYRYRRHKRAGWRLDYTSLDHTFDVPGKLDKKTWKRMALDSARDASLMTCQLYTRSVGYLVLLDHLPEMGSRQGKQWFLVRDHRTKSEKLLTMVPRGPNLLLPFNKAMNRTLGQLFRVLQHPYLRPVEDLDFALDQDLVITCQPYNERGSLKDQIYSSTCTANWVHKYTKRGRPLPAHNISNYGRQILEALIFLQSKGFPPLCHLHSGNVLVEEFVCRVTGLENTLLGMSPKRYPLIQEKLQNADKYAIDSICFGHLLFEMSAGYELSSPHPRPSDLNAVTHGTLKKVLLFIFQNPQGRYPTIKQIAELDFFKASNLQELEYFTPGLVRLTKPMRTVLKAVRKGRHLERIQTAKKKRDSLTAAPSHSSHRKSRGKKPKESADTSIAMSQPVLPSAEQSKKEPASLRIPDIVIAPPPKQQTQKQGYAADLPDVALVEPQKLRMSPSRQALLDEIRNRGMMPKSQDVSDSAV